MHEQTIRIEPRPRGAGWAVRVPGHPATLEFGEMSAARRAAHRLARDRGLDAVVMRDRYWRVHVERPRAVTAAP